MKKVFLKFLFFNFFLSIFCTILFSQEIIIVDEGKSSYEINLELYNEFSSLLKDYFVTGQDEFLKTYTVKCVDLYSVENACSEMQSFMVAESLFYWNYFRKSILDENSKKIIDENIIAFWNNLFDLSDFHFNSVVVYNFVKSFSSFLDKEFVLPIQNFEIEKNNFEYELASEVFVRNDFYQSLSQAEGMLYRLNKNIELAKLEMKMADDTFYKVCNNPKLLYVIFNNEKYSPLLNSFLATATSLYDLEFELDNNTTNFESYFTILPEFIFTKIYSNIPEEYQNEDINIQYEFINNFSKFTLKQIKEGFDIEKIFSTSELEMYNKILENNYFAFCVDLNFLKNFLDKTNIILNFDYSTSLIISNLKVESEDYE